MGFGTSIGGGERDGSGALSRDTRKIDINLTRLRLAVPGVCVCVCVCVCVFFFFFFLVIGFFFGCAMGLFFRCLGWGRVVGSWSFTGLHVAGIVFV